LENRFQPGSLLSAGTAFGAAVLGISILDPDAGSLASGRAVTDDTSVVNHRPARLDAVVTLVPDNSLSALAFSNSPAPSDQTETPVSPESATSPATSRPLTDDSLALQVAAGRTPAEPLVAMPARGNVADLYTSSTTSALPPAAQAGQPATSGLASPLQQLGNPAPLHHAPNAVAIPESAISSATGTLVQNGAHFQSANLRETLISSVPPGGAGAGNVATLTWSTFLGGAGEDGLSATALDSAGNIYVSGYSDTTGTGKVDGFVAKLTPDGGTVLWSVALNGGIGRDEAHGIAVKGNNVYVVGSFSNGGPANCPTDGFIAQLDASNGNLLNSVAITNGNLQGVTVDNTADMNVYVAGWVCVPRPPATPTGKDILIAKLDMNLNQPSPAFYTSAFHFQLPGPPPIDVDTGANKYCCIAVDDQGNAYVSGTFRPQGDPMMDSQALYLRVNAAGTMTDWAFRFTNVNVMTGAANPGPNGGGTGVAVSGGFVYVTGNNNDTANAGNPLNQDLILAKLPLTGPPLTYGVLWYVDNRLPPTFNRVGDWQANCIKVLPNGSTIVTGAAFDPAAPLVPPISRPTFGVDVTVTHFTPDGMSTTQNPDGDPENIFGGANADIGCGMALDANNNPIVVGVTKSSDFPTAGAAPVQPTYGGDPSDGFVAKLANV
jgi:hypothetical protein